MLRILTLVLLCTPLAAAQEHTSEITYAELMAHAKYLADDDLGGRAAGSEGAVEAAAYIATEFERLGLKPAGDGETYFQGFTLPRGFKALPTTTLLARKGRKEVKFKFEKDIYPLPSSASGLVEGNVVFTGYGISAPDLNYDDYEDIDVKGKIVVVLRGTPNNKSRKNPFNSQAANRRYATLKSKQDTAAGLGALGIIVVNDPENFGSKSKDKLVTTGSREQGRLPALHMTYAAGRKMLSDTGVSLSKFQKLIDSRLEPRSREASKLEVTLNADLEVQKLDVRNVVGLLEAAAQDKKDEVVVVGAHFDHIGLGEFGSLGGSKAKGQVHNGADDNASGTAGVMEIAGYLKPRAEELKRDVLFVCFTAEEMGLLGSKHYVDAPAVPLAKTAAMLNLDMVSYLGKTGRLEIYGVGTSPSFERLIHDANKRLRVKTREIKGVGRGASDHYPFYKKSLPALFFITGLHKNYHRPTDDVKYMDKRGFEKVVRLAGGIAFQLATAEAKPVFTPTSEGGLESGPFLGASLEQREGGVYVAEVAKGSPASRGGLKVGDELVEVKEKEIESVRVFYGLWIGVQPGERVPFLIRRQGKYRTVKVTLKK